MEGFAEYLLELGYVWPEEASIAIQHRDGTVGWHPERKPEHVICNSAGSWKHAPDAPDSLRSWTWSSKAFPLYEGSGKRMTDAATWASITDVFKGLDI